MASVSFKNILPFAILALAIFTYWNLNRGKFDSVPYTAKDFFGMWQNTKENNDFIMISYTIGNNKLAHFGPVDLNGIDSTDNSRTDTTKIFYSGKIMIGENSIDVQYDIFNQREKGTWFGLMKVKNKDLIQMPFGEYRRYEMAGLFGK
jgi:hypothetical protein